jgi:hypothetical protein
LFFSGSVVVQAAVIGLLLLPIAFSAVFLSLGMAFFLDNPESIPWNTAFPPSPGQVFVVCGLFLLWMGAFFSKIKLSFVARTKGVFYFFNRADRILVFLLTAVSLVMVFLAVVFARPPVYCAVVSGFTALLSFGSGIWMQLDIDQPD